MVVNATRVGFPTSRFPESIMPAPNTD